MISNAPANGVAEPERIGFARHLVSTTDRLFVIATSPGRLARPVRTKLMPAVVSRLFRLPAMRRLMFRIVSQTQLSYRKGPLAAGAARGVHGGDRLPWLPRALPGTDADNFATLTGVAWQAQVYGRARLEAARACAARGIELRTFPWQPYAKAAGFVEDGLYLVRPDGYLGMVDGGGHAAPFERYLDRLAVGARGI